MQSLEMPQAGNKAKKGLKKEMLQGDVKNLGLRVQVKGNDRADYRNYHPNRAKPEQKWRW